jgi:hypothetical protein
MMHQAKIRANFWIQFQIKQIFQIRYVWFSDEAGPRKRGWNSKEGRYINDR